MRLRQSPAKKKSGNPGAHKKRVKESNMKFVDNPKWLFWSGKLGWDGFDQDSWDALGGLYKEAMDTNMPKTG